MKFRNMFLFSLAVISLTKNPKHFSNTLFRIFKKIFENLKISQIFVQVLLYFGVQVTI